MLPDFKMWSYLSNRFLIKSKAFEAISVIRNYVDKIKFVSKYLIHRQKLTTKTTKYMPSYSRSQQKLIHMKIITIFSKFQLQFQNFSESLFTFIIRLFTAKGFL